MSLARSDQKTTKPVHWDQFLLEALPHLFAGFVNNASQLRNADGAIVDQLSVCSRLWKFGVWRREVASVSVLNNWFLCHSVRLRERRSVFTIIVHHHQLPYLNPELLHCYSIIKSVFPHYILIIFLSRVCCIHVYHSFLWCWTTCSNTRTIYSHL
jgi:hypothetical protein